MGHNRFFCNYNIQFKIIQIVFCRKYNKVLTEDICYAQNKEWLEKKNLFNFYGSDS